METLPAIAVLPDADASDLPAVLPPMELLEGLADLIGADTRKESTKASYASDVRAFEQFAAASGIDDASGRPAHPLWVASWIVAMRNDGNAPKTIERRVRGLGSDHRMRGYADPTTHPIVVDAIKKSRLTSDHTTKQAHAIKPQDLALIADKIDTDTLAGARDKAMLLLGFACALRVSELAKLNVEDIALSDDRVALTIRDAKTAKSGEVQVVIASCSPDEDLCPVESMRDWLEMSGIESGPAFRGITRHNTIRSTAISTRAVGDILKSRAKGAGVIGWADVSAHSLRRGWATTAAAKGVPAAIIKQHGRWKTLATAELYIDGAGSVEAMAATRSVIAGISYADAMGG